MKALELADAYADACFDQALNARTEDPIPEQKRDELAAELRRLAAQAQEAASQPAQQRLKVTDAMAYAFHGAISDGSLGSEEVEDIKRGLAAAFANYEAAQWEPSAWHRIEEDAEVDVPLDTDLLLAWWDEWSEAWKIEANYAGSERGGWRHGRATHWMPLPAPPSAAQQKGASHA